MFRYMFLSLTASAASTQVLIAHVETTGTECAHVMVRPLTPQTVSILSRRAAQDRPGQPVVGRRQHIGRQRGHPRELPCSMRSVRTSYSGPAPPFSGPGRQQSRRPGLAWPGFRDLGSGHRSMRQCASIFLETRWRRHSPTPTLTLDQAEAGLTAVPILVA
jgi:hypothetical protein